MWSAALDNSDVLLIIPYNITSIAYNHHTDIYPLLNIKNNIYIHRTCRALSALGASPNIRNAEQRNACNIARTAGWSELADWLEKKVGSGVGKIETYSDIQYDKQVRYGKVRA